MRRFCTLIIIGIGCLALVGESRGQSKFDIVTYVAPPGWETEKDAESIRFTKKIEGSFCVITIGSSIESTGDPAKDFELLWQGAAIESLGVTAEPQRGKAGEKDGWRAEVAIAPFEKDGVKAALMLTSFTGNGKVVMILALTNSESFQREIETFVNNVKLPTIEGQKSPATSAVNSGNAAKLIGRWQRSASGHPSYADAASWGTAGYTKSRYEFKPDGTYIYTERTFRMTHPNIFVVMENGRYSIAGDTLTVTPAKSAITSYRKAGGVDALGPAVSTQNRILEKTSYKFTFHYFSGIQEWKLVLQADNPTQRDGQFSALTVFNNAWYFDQKHIDNDLTAARAN